MNYTTQDDDYDEDDDEDKFCLGREEQTKRGQLKFGDMLRPA